MVWDPGVTDTTQSKETIYSFHSVRLNGLLKKNGHDLRMCCSYEKPLMCVCIWF